MKVEIEFVRDIVGHDLETIQQMYNDWNNLPSLKVRAKSSVNVEAEVIKPVAVNYEQPRFKDAEEHRNFLSNTTKIIRDLIANGIMPYKGFKIYDGDDILYIDDVLYDARTNCLEFEITF